MINIQDEYQKFIKGLIEQTKIAKVTWKKQNDTTYYFNSRNEETLITVSVQKIGSADRSLSFLNNYIFQVINTNTKEILVNLETSISRNYSYELGDLYNAIEESIEVKNLDVLNNILKNIKG